MFKVFRKSKVDLDTATGNLCKTSKVDEAWNLFTHLPLNGVEPDVQTYNILISAFFKEGKVLRAEDFYMEMLQKGIVPDTITYSSMIDGFCKQNRLDDAKQMFDSIGSKGCSPDVVTFTTLINGYCKARRVDMDWSFSARCIEGEWLLIQLPTAL